MARPQRSTRDAWLDQFADWSPETQESMLDILQLIHRQTVRRTLRGIEAKANGQPAASIPAPPVHHDGKLAATGDE